jgi:hypothetical protein
MTLKESEKMPNNGKIQWDDLHTSLQSDIATTVSGASGSVGYGFNPHGSVKKIDDNDPAIQYSVGDWTRKIDNIQAGREGNIPRAVTQTGVAGASLTVSFFGTGLYLSTAVNYNMTSILISVDGGTETIVDLYQVTFSDTHGYYVKIADNLTYGFHTAKITTRPKIEGSAGLFNVYYFDVITQPKTKNLVPPFSQWNLSNPANVGTTEVTAVGTRYAPSPYQMNVIKTGTTKFLGRNVRLPVLPSTTYTFSCNVTVSGIGGTIGVGAYYNLTSLDSNGAFIADHHTAPYATANGSTTFTKTFTTASNAYFVDLILSTQDTVTGTFVFTNPTLTTGSIALTPFETNGYDKVVLGTDSVLNKSSAFAGGNLIDATTNLTKDIPEITNLIPNSNFGRMQSTWGLVFQDNFNRANGAAGNGWSAGTISSNQLSIPNGIACVNGDANWTDRQMKFSFVANTAAALYPVIKSSTNRINAVFLSTQFYFEKFINGVSTSSISPASFALTNGTTYYVTMKAQGNLYSTSITSNADYVTGATTIYHYEEGIQSGNIYFITSGGNVLVDNVTVTIPVPDVWQVDATTGQMSSFYDGIYKRTHFISQAGSMYNSGSATMQKIAVVPGNTYTYSVKRKVNSYTSGSGAMTILGWYKADGTPSAFASTWSSYRNAVDSDFVIQTITATAPSDAASANIVCGFDGIGSVEYKDLMVTLGSTVTTTFHTKESRCDLVSLQNDGQIVITQGDGSSELGYRVEEDGSISTFHRDKRTVQHFDRAKVWKSGTWSQFAGSGFSSGSRLHNATTNDAFYISFVGTGLDLLRAGDSTAGIAGVSIDGGSEFWHDFYTAVAGEQIRTVLARNLPYGQHTVKIRVTGTKNSLSAANYISVDAFDIYVPAIPANPSPTTLLPIAAVIKADPDNGWIRYEDNEGVVYSGNWGSFSNAVDSGGTHNTNVTGTSSDYAEFSFIGNAIQWIGYKATDAGIVEVSLNGLTQGNIDCYNSSTIANVSMAKYLLPFGLNKIKLRNTMTKNASSSATNFVVDAFEVKNSMYVIDLRKNVAQTLIEQKIAEHEAKDLWDAHPQALKGKNLKERREDGSVNGTIVTAGNYIAVNVTYAKAFTVPPKFKMWYTSSSVGIAGYMTATLGSPTTTGVTIYINSYTPQVVTLEWEAIGY